MTWVAQSGTTMPDGINAVSSWEHTTSRRQDTAVPMVVVNRGEIRRNRKRVRKEKLDIRARCVTCICLILMCAIGLGVVGIMLMSESNTGFFGPDATTPEDHRWDCHDRGDASTVTNTPMSSKVTDAHSKAELLPTTRRVPVHVPGYSRICVPVNDTQSVCGVLPYEYTTIAANITAYTGIDKSFFSRDKTPCHNDWWFFLCAYVMPECKPNPPKGWLPRCLCTEINATIYATYRCEILAFGRSGIESSKLTCDNRADPGASDCLKP